MSSRHLRRIRHNRSQPIYSLIGFLRGLASLALIDLLPRFKSLASKERQRWGSKVSEDQSRSIEAGELTSTGGAKLRLLKPKWPLLLARASKESPAGPQGKMSIRTLDAILFTSNF